MCHILFHNSYRKNKNMTSNAMHLKGPVLNPKLHSSKEDRVNRKKENERKRAKTKH